MIIVNPYRLALSCALTLCLNACATSNFEFERGKKSYLQQDYRQAFIRLKPSAVAGNPQAQYAIGYMYYNGQGTSEDKTQGVAWMEKAASRGNLTAIQALQDIHSQAISPYASSKDAKQRPLSAL